MIFWKAISVVATVVFLTGMVYGADDFVLKTDRERTSYAVGAQMGGDMRQYPINLDPDVVARGFKDAFLGKKLLLDEEQMSKVMAAIDRAVREHKDELRETAVKNKKEGEAFLAQNKAKDGVTTLPSGLQYRITKMGAGPVPQVTDKVEINFRATLIDGREVDSSYKRGQPVTVAVNGVIKGWTEALQLMKVGSKWQLFVPSELANGEEGAGPIGPNATLVFELELLSIK
jgi:FKBP-type peptidyl-prolyl cis-trans isomerase